MIPLQIADEFEEAPTVEIPRETMLALINGSKRDVEPEISTGVPVAIQGTEPTEPVARA
jgi:hypothetical protein